MQRLRKLTTTYVIAIFGILILNSTVSLVAFGQPTGQFTSNLKGSNEVPPVESNANGQVEFTLPSNDIIKYVANVTGIFNASAAHIHIGKAGENGDIIADLLNTPESKDKDTAYGMIFRGNVTDSSLKGPMEGKTLDDLVSAMDSSDVYVNVHTPEHPDGEIRGQIAHSNRPSLSTNWAQKCSSLEWGLMNTCDAYVKPDGSLTQEGVRANNCITNGALLSGAGVLVGRSPEEIIGLLEPAAALTGCGGIVDFVKLKQATDPTSLLKALGIQ